MFVIPHQLNDTDFVAFIILHADNITRIQEYDPAELRIAILPPPWRDLRMVEVQITFCTADEQATVIALCQQNKKNEALRLLTRGYRFRPDMGDGLPIHSALHQMKLH